MESRFSQADPEGQTNALSTTDLELEDKKSNAAESNVSNGDSKAIPQPSNNTTPGSNVKSASSVPVGKEGADRYKLWLRFEQVGLVAVVIIIWGLFLLPIVFYHLPVSSSSTGSSGTLTCSSAITYDGTVCRQELSAFTNCLPDTEQDGVVLIQSDQSEAIGPLLNALNLFASRECREAALPFLCVYFFGLCDSTGKAYRPSSSQCTEISTGVCAREWILASSLPDVTLPDCSSFPDETMLVESCLNMNESSENQTQCRCNEDFFCKPPSNGSADGELCVPECGIWEEYPHRTVVIIDVIVILAAIVGVVSGIGVLIIAGVRRKKVLVFPSVFAVYQTITIVVLACFALINYMNRTGLYCSSRDLIEAVETATPFCIISGMVFHYTVMQLALWWLFHIMALFWKIQFPFHARRFQSARRVPYLHFTAVVLALVLPAIPIIIAMIEYAVEDSKDGSSSPSGKLGFGLIRFPPIFCVGNDRSVIVYSFILPLILITIAGMTLLVFVFWIIHKQHGLFRIKQSKNLFKIETAERKILIVFCYYVILVIFTLIAFTITTRNVDEFAQELLNYFGCESRGHQPNMTCSREAFESLSMPELTSISYILLGLFPLASFVFVVNVQEVKELFKQFLTKIRPRAPTDQQTTSSVANTSDPTSTGTAVSVSNNVPESCE